MQEFLLVDTETPQVQLYRRESNNRRIVYILNYDDEVELTSLGVRFQSQLATKRHVSPSVERYNLAML